MIRQVGKTMFHERSRRHRGWSGDRTRFQGAIPVLICQNMLDTNNGIVEQGELHIHVFILTDKAETVTTTWPA